MLSSTSTLLLLLSFFLLLLPVTRELEKLIFLLPADTRKKLRIFQFYSLGQGSFYPKNLGTCVDKISSLPTVSPDLSSSKSREGALKP